MHLHLGGKDSDVLVFPVQYSDRVVLVGTSMHLHFRTRPAGKNILALAQAWYRTLENSMAIAAATAASSTDPAERRGAEELRDKPAAAITAFQAGAGFA